MTYDKFRQAPSLSFLGKRQEVIAAMRFSGDASIVEFLKVWDSTPVCDRKQIPFELIALKANVDVNNLVGAYIMCFRSLQAQKSSLKAMAAHPKLVDSTILYAGMPGGERDRRMLHEAVGFLPTPKGLTINQNFGQPQVLEEREDSPAEIEVDDLFPMINEKQEKWQGNRTKLLED